MTHRAPGGFALVNVMAALLVFAVGMIGLLGAFARFVSVSTANEVLTRMADWSNAFWGIVQANPDNVLGGIPSGSVVTYAAAGGSIGGAPSALQPWLDRVLSSRYALPSGSVKILTGPDPSDPASAACDPASGCSVTLTLSWTPVGNNPGRATRVQTFHYVFGL